jgi:hypothetical protein
VFRAGAINIYFVKEMSADLGLTYMPLRVSYIQDIHDNSNVSITAHELGHQMGIPYDVGLDNVPGNADRLMWYAGLSDNPCRLIRTEWQTINNTAKSF